jgi:hypothetical protein
MNKRVSKKSGTARPSIVQTAEWVEEPLLHSPRPSSIHCTNTQQGLQRVQEGPASAGACR